MRERLKAGEQKRLAEFVCELAASGTCRCWHLTAKARTMKFFY